MVHLRNGNIPQSIQIANSVHMKETYESMDLLLKAMLLKIWMENMWRP